MVAYTLATYICTFTFLPVRLNTLPTSPHRNFSGRRRALQHGRVACSEESSSGNQPSTSALDIMQQLARDEGFVVSYTVSDEEIESWEDVMEEVEDPWMREPTESSFPELTDSIVVSQEVAGRTKNIPVITAEDYQSMKAIDDNGSIVLLDVRQKDVFDISHVPEATNIPLEDLNASATEALRSKTVVVSSSGDSRSMQACIRMSKVHKLDTVFHLT